MRENGLMSFMSLWVDGIDVIYIHPALFQIHSLDQEMSLYFISIYTWVNYERTLATNKTLPFPLQGATAPPSGFQMNSWPAVIHSVYLNASFHRPVYFIYVHYQTLMWHASAFSACICVTIRFCMHASARYTKISHNIKTTDGGSE